MAFSVSIHKDLNLIYTEYSGFVGTEDLLKARNATIEHPDNRLGLLELTNLSGVTDTDLDFSQVFDHRLRMAEHYGESEKKTEHFMIAPTDLVYGMGRMYQTLAEDGVSNMNLQLFRTEREALQAMGRVETSIAELLRPLKSD